MESKIKVSVPAIHSAMDANKKFKADYEEALAKADEVLLDFQNHAAISSITLGVIMFGMRNHRSKLRFINLSDYLVDSLRTIIGGLADDLMVGPITKLDIELHKGSA